MKKGRETLFYTHESEHYRGRIVHAYMRYYRHNTPVQVFCRARFPTWGEYSDSFPRTFRRVLCVSVSRCSFSKNVFVFFFCDVRGEPLPGFLCFMWCIKSYTRTHTHEFMQRYRRKNKRYNNESSSFVHLVFVDKTIIMMGISSLRFLDKTIVMGVY